MVSVEYLLDYVLVEPRLSKTYWYFSKKKECCFCYDDLSESDLSAFEKDSSEKLIVKMPRISLDELKIMFVESFNDERVSAYLNLFGNEEKVVGAERIIYCQSEEFYSQDGVFQRFCINYALPILMKWGNENNIDISKVKTQSFCCDKSNGIENIVLPTDGIAISNTINLSTFDDMYFDRNTYSFIDSTEINDTPYIDCIKVPYIDDFIVYNAYLKSNDTINFIDTYNSKEDFCAAFREFIYYNGYYDEFWTFKNEYLKPYIIDWCEKNNIIYKLD